MAEAPSDGGLTRVVGTHRCHACQLHPRGQHGTSRGRYPDSRIDARRPPSQHPARQWRTARQRTPRSQWRDRAGFTPTSLHRGPSPRLYSWTSY
ncbi:hypothetical protein SFR_0437 [Streptomyces sp. FR-008]|nr:hypothetical protein SFR_0437 [Streptomyces sp. FR-008]